MKQLPAHFLLLFMGLVLIACNDTTKKKNSSLDQNAICMNNPYAAGCYGTTTNGTNNQACNIGSNYWQMVGCPGYCQHNPTHANCGGSTTGTTTGTTTGGTNPYTYYPSNGVTPNWGVKYPGGVPSGSCSEATDPDGINYTPYETRKATMTIVGKAWYNPADSNAANYLNTSSLLKSITGARQLFDTDSILKVRFKVNPQPESTNNSPYCYGRQSGSAIAGYTKLKYTVQLVGRKANNQIETEPVGTFETGVNNCSPAIDLSSYVSMYPNGIYLIVQSVKGNQGTWPNNYDYFGFRDVNYFSDIRTRDCWTLDVEIAVDGTKTFD